MSTRTQSIAKMAAALAGNPNAEKEVECEIARNSMVSHLLTLRVSRGLTQEQVAQAMKCDASKISRLESGNDLALRWGDIVGYAHALNMELCVMFDDPSVPAATRIKQCVFRIREDLDCLTDLAKQVGGSDEVAKKIHQFSGEVLFNFLLQYRNHHEELRSIIKVSQPAPGVPPCEPEAPAPTEAGLQPAGA